MLAHFTDIHEFVKAKSIVSRCVEIVEQQLSMFRVLQLEVLSEPIAPSISTGLETGLESAYLE